MAVSCVCYVGGNAAENPSIPLSDGSHLENTLWQKNVPGGREVREEVRFQVTKKTVLRGVKPGDNAVPVVSTAEWHSVSLPDNVGFGYTVDLTLEAGHTTLIHGH